MKKTHYIYLDLETTKVEFDKTKYKNLKEYYEHEQNPQHPKIYGWCAMGDTDYSSLEYTEETHYEFKSKKFKIDDTLNTLVDIDGSSFINMIENIKVDAIGYFNNLRSFDGHFIVPLLDENGYTSVVPFETYYMEDVDEHLKVAWLNRFNDIKNKIFENDKIKNKYDEIYLDSKKQAFKWLSKLVKKQWKLLNPKEYSVLADSGNKIYEIKIGIGSTKKTNGKTRNRAFIIRDNMYLFPSSVANMGKSMVKTFKSKVDPKDLAKLKGLLQKKEISGGYNRTELYKSLDEYKEDGNEYEYLKQDVYTLYKFHKTIEKIFPRKHWKLTIGSTTYKDWIRTLGSSFITTLELSGAITIETLKRGVKRINYKDKLYSTQTFKKMMLDKFIPSDWLNNYHDESMNTFQFLYQWYGGGMTFVNEQHRGKFLTNLSYKDLNSSYPSQMVKDVKVPFGRGLVGNVKGYDFKFYTLTPKKKIHNKKGLPFLFNQNSAKREYQTTLEPFGTYRFTSLSLDNFYKYYDAKPSDYDLKIEYSFQTIDMSFFFKEYILHWYKVKEQASKDGNVILKMIAKLYINNLYGKLGTKILRVSSYWDQQKQEWFKISEEKESQFYLPLAIAITELGRKSLVDACGDQYESVAYGDTDSLVCIDWTQEKFPNMYMHDTELGAWDTEHENMYGVFRRAKQYMLLNNDGDQKISYSGINFNRYLLSDKENEYAQEIPSLSLVDYIVGKPINSQLTPHRLLGYGIAFEEIVKEIKPIWSYDPLSQQINYKKEHFIDQINIIKEFGKNNIIQVN